MPEPETPQESRNPHDPAEDTESASYEKMPGKKGRGLPNQTTWIDQNQWHDDAGCVLVSEPAACDSCLQCARKQAERDEDACAMQQAQDESGCYADHDNGLDLGSCMEDAHDET